MAITSAYVELHNSIKSYNGSEMISVMPATSRVHPTAPSQDGNADLDALCCLVVDDHRFSRTLIKTALRTHGITDIVEAADAPEAFRILGSDDYRIDLILVDHDMPILSGVEFTRMIRRGIDVPDPEIPIIMVSGLSARETVLEARNCGIHEFVAKPFSAETLYLHIVRTIQNPRPFIRADSYIGPDRRWLNQKPATIPERRQPTD